MKGNEKDWFVTYYTLLPRSLRCRRHAHRMPDTKWQCVCVGWGVEAVYMSMGLAVKG